jgi:phi13 family phage major tail protein
MDNKVMFGLEKVHVAFTNSTGYDEPIAIPGAVNLSLSAEGESNTFYADNVPYFSITSNNGYAGDLEMALVPDSVLAEMLGWEIDDNGMLVEIADGIQKEFALLFEVKGNEKNKRYVYYNCKASRPNQEHGTKGETVEPNTQTLTVAITPTEIGGKTVVKGGLELSETNKTVYDAFFESVLEPSFTATPSTVDKTELDAAIALAGTLESASYTTESWDVLSAALTVAETISADAEATQIEVNSATKALIDAIIDLVPEAS